MRIFKRVLLSLFGLALILALWIYVEDWRAAYGYYSKDAHGYMGLQIGASRDEALYVFGYPKFVLGPIEHSAEGDSQRVYQVDGQDPKNVMPAGTSINTYFGWQSRRDGHRVDITFDPKTHLVTDIGCYAERSLADSSCPPIFGVITGIDEDQLTERLGKADFVKHDGVSKSLRYEALGLDVTLTERNVYMIDKHATKGIAWNWLLWHVWL